MAKKKSVPLPSSAAPPRRVFISWAKPRAKAVARALKPWIRMAAPEFDVWFSEQDIRAGERWAEKIGHELDSASLGIVCVTPENLTSPWLAFEAGALSKRVNSISLVIPFALGFKDPADIPDPLGQFNAVLADAAGARSVLASLNQLRHRPLQDAELDGQFELLWPKLEADLQAIKAPAEIERGRTERSADAKIDEILNLVRALSRARDISVVPDQTLAQFYQRIVANNPSVYVRGVNPDQTWFETVKVADLLDIQPANDTAPKKKPPKGT